MSGYKIGVDGGGSKTECLLIDGDGNIRARHLAPGCNPNVVGPEQAWRIIADALATLQQIAFGEQRETISTTHLYMAGNRTFWRDSALQLAGLGQVFTADDSLPVLELATSGQPGLVLHAGTGSFVAARAPDGSLHYGGGVGWRFGDPGSGYDLGRRAIGRALLELQGWASLSRLSPTVRHHTTLGDTADSGAVTRYFYQHPEANRHIAALAPALLQLAQEGDPTARELISESAGELLALATRVATTLFPATPLETLPAGLSGPILTHPVVMETLRAGSSLVLKPVQGTPIEGVRRLLLRA
jgi:glucosamine kinase